MPINLSVPELTELQPRITVIGVGGAGGNAVNNMIESQLEGVEFVVANTDAQAVGLSKAQKKIQLGVKTTQGLGAGSIPDIGRAAADESLDEILEHVGGCHMLFVTAGMGGGTGTGAAPVIAKAAKERDILTVGVVTKPFHFEGARRMRLATAGIEELQKHVDTLLIIPNQNLFSIANERTTFHEAFAMADQVLHSGVRGITDLMVMPGLINLDFADVRTVMSEMGKAMMGTGEAEGEKRAIQAAEAAISNPLLDEVSMKGAKGVLINITGSMDMTLFEVDEAANRIRAEVDPDANIIVGSTFNQDLEGRVRVSVVATGIDIEEKEQPRPQIKVNTGAVSKPWREPTPVDQPAASSQSASAPSAAASPAPSVSSPAPQSAPGAPARGAAPGANPVGDVHERIRKMLTEGGVAETRAAAPTQAPTPAQNPAQGPVRASAPQRPVRQESPRQETPRQGETANPFRSAQALGKHSLEAAVDMFKSLGGQEEPRRAGRQAASAPRAPEAPKPSGAPRGDLFDDQEDADLEIPSFLRKKKTG
ncbi:cell division protein FtsZ [Hyphococcus luteus]|uniref:Cell division protein FtsZ n=1 Tax=Hyphococcus luteus TaxID=2058213 RepID=A0A2S7K9D0_9PROT|nr:cell division protein FtsZ [Marinicaulis flavus]PQA89081.1 cell division protein FtsZ [Marinicaulis flavus]